MQQGLSIRRRVNTSVVSSAHVTGGISFKPIKELKWKGKMAMTQRELQVWVVFKPDQKLMTFKQGHKPNENHPQRKLLSCVIVWV